MYSIHIQPEIFAKFCNISPNKKPEGTPQIAFEPEAKTKKSNGFELSFILQLQEPFHFQFCYKLMLQIFNEECYTQKSYITISNRLQCRLAHWATCSLGQPRLSGRTTGEIPTA